MGSTKHPVKLKINGTECSARPDTTILEAARAAGIEIPTLCHLQGFRPLATCRICLVEDTRRWVLLPACISPVSDGMDIRTDSPRVLEARKTVVELLLASHPETCLVCDRHGTCLLRKVAAEMGIGRLGVDRIPLQAGYEPATEFIIRNLEKCILCGRCVAVCQEVIVQGAIDYHSRGFQTVVATAGEGPLSAPECLQCAVCVAVCPTGALDHRRRPYRREAPEKTRIVCQHCGCGCGIEVSAFDGKMVGRLPAAGGDDVPQACARGVYENDLIKEGERIHAPLLRKGESLKQVGWDEALEHTAVSLSAIVARHGSNSVAAWCSPLVSCEEGYVLQGLTRDVLHSNCVDVAGSGLLRSGLSALSREGLKGRPTFCSISDVEKSDLILVIGSGVSQQAPVVDFAIRRAVAFSGAKVIIVDDGEENPLARWAALRISSKEDMLSFVMASIGETLFRLVSKYHLDAHVPEERRGSSPVAMDFRLMGVRGEEVTRAAEEILSAQRLSIILGFSGESNHAPADVEEASFIAQASWHKGRQHVAIMPAGAFTNEIGLLRAGMNPTVLPGEEDAHDAGAGGKNGNCKLTSSIEKLREGSLKGLIVFGCDTLQFVNVRFGKEKNSMGAIPFEKLDFMLFIDSRMRPACDNATVVLPLCEHEEREGTFIGIEGIQRVSPAALKPQGNSLSGVEILSRLAAAFDARIAGNLEAIREEMREKGVIT